MAADLAHKLRHSQSGIYAGQPYVQRLRHSLADIP